LIVGRAREDRKLHYHLRLPVAQSAWVQITGNGQHRLVQHHMPMIRQVEITALVLVLARAPDQDSMEDSHHHDHNTTTIAAITAKAVATTNETPEPHPAILPITHDHRHGHNNLATATNYPHDHRQRRILLKMATAEDRRHDEMDPATDLERIHEKVVVDQATKTHIYLPIKLTADVRRRGTAITVIEIESGVVSTISGVTIEITICHQTARDGSIVVRMIATVVVVVAMTIEIGAQMDEVAMMSERGTVGMAEMGGTAGIGGVMVVVVVVVEDYITTNEEAAVKARNNIVRREVEVLRGGIGIGREMAKGQMGGYR
jgi:hypothetical protein